MPISYSIDSSRSLIHTRCVGDTTLPEVLEHFRELRNDPKLPAQLNVLLDLTGVTNAPQRDHLRAVVTEMKELAATLNWGALAIVARSDLLFGMSRIIGVFVADVFTSTGVFRQVREAERWIESRLD